MRTFIFITFLVFKSMLYAQVQNSQQLNLLNKRVQEVMDCKLPDSKLYQKEEARIYRLIEGQAHHLRGLLHPWKEDSSMLLITKSESGEHGVRPSASHMILL
jgi:hypothetical protein